MKISTYLKRNKINKMFVLILYYIKICFTIHYFNFRLVISHCPIKNKSVLTVAKQVTWKNAVQASKTTQYR